MISAYAVIALVFGLVLSYLGLIHRFWLRDVFREVPKSVACALRPSPGAKQTAIQEL